MAVTVPAVNGNCVTISQTPPTSGGTAATVRTAAGPSVPLVTTTNRWSAPSLRQAARDRLAARGWDTDEIEATLDERTGREVVREYEIVPPALTTNGARNLLQRLCDDAGIDIDGEYLKPHGGRRGLGSEIYEQDAELAQETLRHQSVETTHAAYRDRNVAAQRDRIEAALSRDEDSDDS
mgnify:FL=1